MSAPRTPAAFINAIADSGTKAEAVEWLQRTWNERCQLERQRDEAVACLRDIERIVENTAQETALTRPERAIRDVARSLLSKYPKP